MRITAMKNVKANNVLLNIELNWRKVSNAVKKATAKSIGELKSQETFGMTIAKLILKGVVRQVTSIQRTIPK